MKIDATSWDRNTSADDCCRKVVFEARTRQEGHVLACLVEIMLGVASAEELEANLAALGGKEGMS